jgi:hypothetical protein
VYTLTTADVLLLVVVEEGSHLAIRSWRKTLSWRYVWGVKLRNAATTLAEGLREEGNQAE